jgi:hypothetical protein
MHTSVTPIPNPLLLIYRMLLLLLLLPVKPPKLIRFNLHLPVKIKIKRKGRVRIRRTKIIINHLIKPKHNPLMRKINVSLVTLVLFVVMTIIRKIVHDVLRLLSSSKGTRIPLHLPSCHNHFLLSSRLNWSFMTNPLPLPHIMSLCLLVTLRRMKLPSQHDPKITPYRRRKLMIYHLRWFNLVMNINIHIQ